MAKFTDEDYTEVLGALAARYNKDNGFHAGGVTAFLSMDALIDENLGSLTDAYGLLGTDVALQVGVGDLNKIFNNPQSVLFPAQKDQQQYVDLAQKFIRDYIAIIIAVKTVETGPVDVGSEFIKQTIINAIEIGVQPDDITGHIEMMQEIEMVKKLSLDAPEAKEDYRDNVGAREQGFSVKEFIFNLKAMDMSPDDIVAQLYMFPNNEGHIEQLEMLGAAGIGPAEILENLFD